MSQTALQGASVLTPRGLAWVEDTLYPATQYLNVVVVIFLLVSTPGETLFLENLKTWLGSDENPQIMGCGSPSAHMDWGCCKDTAY